MTIVSVRCIMWSLLSQPVQPAMISTDLCRKSWNCRTSLPKHPARWCNVTWYVLIWHFLPNWALKQDNNLFKSVSAVVILPSCLFSNTFNNFTSLCLCIALEAQCATCEYRQDSEADSHLLSFLPLSFLGGYGVSSCPGRRRRWMGWMVAIVREPAASRGSSTGRTRAGQMAAGTARARWGLTHVWVWSLRMCVWMWVSSEYTQAMVVCVRDQFS